MTVKDILERVDERVTNAVVAVRGSKGGSDRVLFDQDSTYREFKAVRDMDVIEIWPAQTNRLLIYVKKEG